MAGPIKQKNAAQELMTLTLKTNLPGRGPRGFILVPFPRDGREGVSDPKPKGLPPRQSEETAEDRERGVPT